MSDLSARLEPFVLLARSAKGAAAAKIINDAVSANGVYVFAELLALPNIQELAGNAAFEKQLNLLKLFAYGTLTDYTSRPDIYPPPSAPQLVKLKHLTLVSLALQHRSLTYEQLASSLQTTSVRELEDLIIDVIYAGLLRGKMHHHEKVLHVDWVAGRDVGEDELGKLKAGLENWCRTAQTLLDALDAQIDHTIALAAQKQEDESVYLQTRDADFTSIFAELQAETRDKLMGRERRAEDASGRERRVAEDMLGLSGRPSRGASGSGGGQGLGGRKDGVLAGPSSGTKVGAVAETEAGAAGGTNSTEDPSGEPPTKRLKALDVKRDA